MQWWDCSANIFCCQGRLGREAIGGEVLLDGGAKECPVDEKFKWNGLRKLQKSIHERRECITAEI